MRLINTALTPTTHYSVQSTRAQNADALQTRYILHTRRRRDRRVCARRCGERGRRTLRTERCTELRCNTLHVAMCGLDTDTDYRCGLPYEYCSCNAALFCSHFPLPIWLTNCACARSHCLMRSSAYCTVQYSFNGKRNTGRLDRNASAR